jgi:Cytochrome b5-like Heme/Steroid binding domain
MRKLLAMVVALCVVGSGVAVAHQPVVLMDTDTTAAKGPLLVDGTVSFAIRASFTKSGQKKAFRAQFKDGDQLSVQYLIVDAKPENGLRMTALPSVVISGPKGTKPVTIKLNERTKFYEPYGGTNYLYLGRYSAPAVAGIYSFVITARGKAAITIGVGEKEIPGEVARGPVPMATPKPAVSATPSQSSAPIVGYTMAQVKANNTAKSCWTAIDGFVYDLTKWISAHPGGSGAILFLCGTDGSNAFKAQHEQQARPAVRLDSYKLGPLNK